MNARTETALLAKLQTLSPQHLAEVEDFVEFLVAREARSAAAASLGESLSRLDTLNLPPLSDAEIEAEIQTARTQRSRT